MRRVKQLLTALGLFLAAIGALWVGSVRAVPGVRRRKAATRAARDAGAR